MTTIQTPAPQSQPTPTRAELMAATGVLLIVDEIQPPSGPVAKGATATPKPPEIALFLAVRDDGQVFAFNGHVDLGTGIQTALTQIVAEELDLRMDQLRMVLGDTGRAPNQGATIASATIQISAIPLRNAAAEARRFLLERAATLFGVPAGELRVEEGAVIAPEAGGIGNRRISYGELVRGERVELRISGKAPLKAREQYKLVGKGAPRVDIPAKATGEFSYVHDLRLPGMLHGRVVRPPYAGIDSGEFVGNSLESIDEGSIAHIPGVIKVVVLRDFVGVVAEREEQAIKAARELKITWKPWTRKLPDLSNLAQALHENPSTPRKVLDKGDVDTALAAADQRMTRTYVWPYQMHGSIGPSCAVADCKADHATVWSGTQNPHLLRADLAWLLEWPEERIDVVRMEAAGCYGRNCADDVAADALLLSQAVGRPVRVQLTREQEHLWEPKGTAQLMEVDGGIDADGGIVAYDFATSYPSNGAPTLALLLTGRVDPVAAVFEMGDRTSIPPYDYENMRVVINDMAPIVRASWMRGVSAMPNSFAHDSYIDELAFAAGVDPVEFRLRHLREDERAADLIRAVAGRAGWQPRTAPQQTPPEGDVLRGRGFAYARYIHSKFPGFGAAWAAWVADVAVDRKTGEIAVTRVVVGHDAGQMINPDGVRHQIHGNVIQSTSRVLKEQVEFEDSVVAAKEWGGYPILTFPEVPDIDVLMMPRENEPPLGSGESASVPSAAAIANAIFDATGIRFRELPITAERVREALNGPSEPVPPAPPEAVNPRKRGWKAWLGASLTGLCGVMIGMASSALPFRAEIAPVSAPSAGLWSNATIERGRQLAALGDCAVCHTAENGATNAGGRPFETPFGTVYSTNITPDPDSGIGRWSFAAFDRAMREGISRDGRHLYPAFPYTAFRNMTDDDMQALYAYMMTQQPVRSETPANTMRFPFNLRPMMAGWNTLFLNRETYKPAPQRSAEWNRGNYLVNGLGHCAACHSPRNALGAEKLGDAFLAGGTVDGWEAPALNGLSKAPKPWTEDDLFTYLRTGFSQRHGVAAGPMAAVVHELSTVPEADVRAMAVYLASLGSDVGGDAVEAPAATPAPVSTANGERIFNGACQACHSDGNGPTLFGVSPSMAVNSNVHSDSPDNLARVILHGIQNPATRDLGYMPAFRDSLSDKQVADLMAYLRGRFAPDKVAWTDVANAVTRARANPGTH
nr:molybdopterin cofactor-binding domain-containing protein [uncultured Azospirillum sp.]